MAQYGEAQGGAVQSDAGIAQVVSRYASQGGELLGARRSPDNPLILTHVRWQGVAGQMLQAEHDVDDSQLSAAERHLWVELAVHLPMSYTIPSGPDSPWLPLMLEPPRLRELLAPLMRAPRPEAQSRTAPPGTPSAGYAASRPSLPPMRGPLSGGIIGAADPSRAPTTNLTHRRLEPLAQPGGPLNRSRPPGIHSGDLPLNPPRSMPSGESFAFPCIEVELPVAIVGAVSPEYTQTFARDVAVHFRRAAEAMPQVREVRGWMRGGRLMLAARMAVAFGARQPSAAEAERGAQALAASLARGTLPYVRMTFAAPDEWAQGVALPG